MPRVNLDLPVSVPLSRLWDNPHSPAPPLRARFGHNIVSFVPAVGLCRRRIISCLWRTDAVRCQGEE